MSILNYQPAQPAFRSLLAAMAAEESQFYLVGGVVRDHFLGHSAAAHDLDLVVEHSAIPIARRVADKLGWAFYALDPVRDVARILFQHVNGAPLVADIAAMRNDSIEADLRARDFTVNAMALRWTPKNSTLIDPTNGAEDLHHLLLRRVSSTSLVEDPVRLLRAVRLANALSFTIEDDTMTQIMRVADTVKLASAERIRDELWRMVTGNHPDRALEMLRTLKMLAPVLPEVEALVGIEQSGYHRFDVYEHTMDVLRHTVRLRNWLLGRSYASSSTSAELEEALQPWLFKLRQHLLQPLSTGQIRSDWLLWHALLHDIGKPATQTMEESESGARRFRFLGHDDVGAELAAQRLAHLRFAADPIALDKLVVRAHMRPHHLDESFGEGVISKRAIYRYFRDTGTRAPLGVAGIDTLLLALADVQGTHGDQRPQHWSRYLRHARELLAYAFSPDGLARVQSQPLLDGHTLMTQLHLLPGKQIGALLDQIAEAQAAGEVANRDEALELAARLAGI